MIPSEMQKRYDELRKIHSHGDAVRFVADEFKTKPYTVCEALGLNPSFLISKSWE
jgi:hypothetical protein